MANYKTLQVLSDLHQSFSDYVGEDNPPAQNDPSYARRTRWFNQGREEVVGAWNFSTLLATATLPLTQGSTTPISLPSDFQSPNDVKSFITVNDGINYTDPYEPNNNTMVISRNFTTGLYQVIFSPAPATTDTGILLYYASPPPMVSPTDLVLIDEDLVVTWGLIQYHKTQGNWTDYQAYKDEFDADLQDLIRQDAINVAGMLTSSQNTEIAKHAQDQTTFYQGNVRKNI